MRSQGSHSVLEGILRFKLEDQDQTTCCQLQKLVEQWEVKSGAQAKCGRRNTTSKSRKAQNHPNRLRRVIYICNNYFPNALLCCLLFQQRRNRRHLQLLCLKTQNSTEWRHCHPAFGISFIFVSIHAWLNLDPKENQR